MNILTNGTDFLHAEAPHSSILDDSYATPIVLGSTSLVFGPIRQEIAPRGLNPWWGRYERGDLLRIELQPGRTQGLTIEVLDENFRALALASADESVNALDVRILRTGVHHVRVRNSRGVEGHYLLVLRLQRSTPPAKQARIAPLRRTIFVALRRAAGLL